MDVRTVIQKILDDTLLPYGVLSNHLRRVDADYIENSDVAVNKDEYVVFRVVSNRPHTFGDGACTLSRVYIDVKNAVLSNKRFRLANDASDIADIDNPYRGLNVEFVYFEVADNG